MSYQRAPRVSSDVSLNAIFSSPKKPFCSSVLLISLKKMTGSEKGPAEYHPGDALLIEPDTEVSVSA